MQDFARFSSQLRTNCDLEEKICLLPESTRTDFKAIRTSLNIYDTEYGLCLSKSLPKIEVLMKSIRKIVIDVMGFGEAPDIIDETVFYFLCLFVNQVVLTRFVINNLKSFFGTTFDGQYEPIFKIVRQISDCIKEEKTTGLMDSTVNIFSKKLIGTFWGHHISIHFPIIKLTDISRLIEISLRCFVDDKICGSTSPLQDYDCTKKNIYELLLLKRSAILEETFYLLKPELNTSEVQNQLCEIFGLHNFEIVLDILSNRETTVETIKKILNSRNNVKNKIAGLNSSKCIPTVSKSVIVQSKLEKELLKQRRKDEKKLNRTLNSDTNIKLSLTTINPIQLRLQQQKKLLDNIRNQPLLRTKIDNKGGDRSINPSYPYVFDCHLHKKFHPAFVGGNKITLPDNAQRIDNNQYEEVKIFASLPPKLIDNNEILIKDLDDIAKQAFHNIKKLNRIQSIVFSTAYHTNNNMLICAPTGAGKTNIAMLTIVAVIRSHLESGIIDRDSFKIIYIAPMKALASEMVENFHERLKPLQINVRELTGDMQLTKAEMQQTQILVTTPEKWDVVTRKGTSDVSIISAVRLLIIDEVHLLHGERGPVVEALVARTLRLVESSQNMIRIVGLSATLPNYIDVAHFLRVNPTKGLFYFDERFRPVPLDMNFIGVKAVKPLQQMGDMDNVCYSKCFEIVQKEQQVMVFVHARNATIRTATMLRDLAQKKNQSALFLPKKSNGYSIAFRSISQSNNKKLGELFQYGISIHHAGMLRTDRRLVEKYFAEGYIRVLVCTATLAWGVNLPAHAVIIRGTDIYDPKHGSFVNLGILDVLQIFGRAGRPQYDTTGVGTIITSRENLTHYLSLLTNQFPIESNFIQCLADNLNAEIASGTVTNVEEAIEWLSYTYLFVRMRINPLCYGIDYNELQQDPNLENRRRVLITSAAISLDKAKMIRFNHRTNDFSITDLGRTASHFYVKYDTVEIFNETMKPYMTEAEIFSMISRAQEFQQLKVRDDELEELDELRNHNCRLSCRGCAENVPEKVNILLQTYLSHGFIKSFSLVSDMSYIVQNVVRLARAIFTIVLRNNNSILAGRMLQISQMFERQQWNTETPFRQFSCLNPETINKIEKRGLNLFTLRDMDFSETKELIRNQKYAALLLQCVNEFPLLELEISLQPITRTVLRIKIDLLANFVWNEREHGKASQDFWIWIEDPETNFIYHFELLKISRKFVSSKSTQNITLTIPLREPLPSQYFVRVTSDTWLGSKSLYPLSFKHLILPKHNPPLTQLLPLQPLAVKALNNHQYESLYSFSHFNPIQTQLFFNLYHTDKNILLGAPTGSGKTIVAEIAILRALQKQEHGKVVYIAPLKALVKERVNDWKIRIERNLRKNVVELTGDTSPDINAIRKSQLIVTTPEKWDSISRSWQTREYVKNVVLIVIDEIHLLGEDRGPVIEVIVSRTNFIMSHTKRFIRIIGLSTALANAQDLANWLGIGTTGLYNFKPSVRPVPLAVHISGFSVKHYCPRMATMNRPTYQAIRTYSPITPVIVFVASRRQTRLTALDLITFVGADNNPKQFLNISDSEIQVVLRTIKDINLKFCLAFGIGLHHAGLSEGDRSIVEDLFLNRKIQILIATATLAWGVNLPARLVVIKGTEYYDNKLKKYVDMPITDVLQMMGRAGRPQFDNEGIAVVFVHDVKKNFYKKFLYDPFPVESSLYNVLPDHINAEIVSGTVQTRESALDFLTWTYFYRRLLRNPSYYKLESVDPQNVNIFLSSLVEKAFFELENASCISIYRNVVVPTFLGRISSFYYLSYRTMKHFFNEIKPNMSTRDLLLRISQSFEFNQLPVRHNEDLFNKELALNCRYQPDSPSYDSPYTKVFLLLQAHIMRLPLPNSDYVTDTKSVLDQTIRVFQALMDYTAERGWLLVTLKLQLLLQCIMQARWFDEPAFLVLPHVTHINLEVFYIINVKGYEHMTLPVLKHLCNMSYERLTPLRGYFEESEIKDICNVINTFPDITIQISLQPSSEDDEINVGSKSVISCNQRINVEANKDYVISINLHRYASVESNTVYCPRYYKPKQEGWILTLGSQSTNEIFAMKRVTVRNNFSVHRLCFNVPPNKGLFCLTLYLISDCYIGLDQQFDFLLNIV